MTTAKLKFLAAMLIFGSIGIFVRHIHIQSEQIVFVRCLIGGGLLLALSVATGRLGKEQLRALRPELGKILLAGFCLGLNWLFLYYAYAHTTVGIATVLYYLAPVMVVGLAPFLLGERLTVDRVVAIAMALAGLVLIVGVNFAGGSDFSGIFYGLVSAAFYAGLMLVNQKFRGVDSLVLTVVQIVVAGTIMGVYSLWNFKGFLPVAEMGLPYLLTLCVVHTALGCYLYFDAQQGMKGQEVAVLSYLDPASAMVFAFLFLGETLTLTQLAGVVLILAATLAVGRVGRKAPAED